MTDGAVLRRLLWSSDEHGTGTLDQEGLDKAFQQTFPAFVFGDGEERPLTLRAGQGFHLKCATNSTVGTFDITFVVTEDV